MQLCYGEGEQICRSLPHCCSDTTCVHVSTACFVCSAGCCCTLETISNYLRVSLSNQRAAEHQMFIPWERGGEGASLAAKNLLRAEELELLWLPPSSAILPQITLQCLSAGNNPAISARKLDFWVADRWADQGSQYSLHQKREWNLHLQTGPCWEGCSAKVCIKLCPVTVMPSLWLKQEPLYKLWMAFLNGGFGIDSDNLGKEEKHLVKKIDYIHVYVVQVLI